jgi:hypothetical protein
MAPPERTTAQELAPWTTAVAAVVGLDPADVSEEVIGQVLDLARDVAHGVARPGAPVTAFLAGLAAGRTGRAPSEVLAELQALALGWSDSDQA